MPSKGKRDIVKDLFEPWIPQGFLSLHMIPSACILTISMPSTMSLHQNQDTCAMVFSSLSTDCTAELLVCSFTMRKRFPCHRAVPFITLTLLRPSLVLSKPFPLTVKDMTIPEKFSTCSYTLSLLPPGVRGVAKHTSL